MYDSFCLTLLLRRFNAPVTFREILPLKGASYLLNIINYNAAMGGMALYLKRVRRVSFLETASSLLFMNVLDVFALCGLIALGLIFSEDALAVALSPESRRGLAWVVAGFAALLVGSWIYWNAGFDFFVLGKLRSWRIFHAFREARLVDYAWLLGLRTVMVFLYVTITWLFARTFGFAVPFGAMLALQPIIIFVGTIPISVAGLGTTQVVMRAFYGVYATYLLLAPASGALLEGLTAPVAAAAPLGGPAAAAARQGLEATMAAYYDPTALVDAFSTASISSVVLLRVLVGYLFVRHVGARLAAAPPEAGEETT